MVTNARQVLHTTAANQNDAVFLKIVAFTSDIGDDFKAVGQAHLGNFTKSGVRLLRSCCVNTGADTAFLRAVVERRLLLFSIALSRGLRTNWLMVGIKSVSETIRKTTLLTEWRLIKNFKENARTLRERTCCTAAEKERRNPGGIPKSSALLRKFNQLSNFSIWLNRLAIVFSVFQKTKKDGLSAAFGGVKT